MKKILYLVILALIVNCSKQKTFIELPSLISDNMVIQQNSNIKIWGKASPNTLIKLESSWGEAGETKSDNNGKFEYSIKTPEAGGPYTLSIGVKDSVVKISNILSGEVWLCSGQSNMEMPLAGWPPGDPINNSDAEIASANYPKIRLFTVPKIISEITRESTNGKWSECTPDIVKNFSATGYFYGKELHKELEVPIGLINSSWGGTPAEAWTSKEKLYNLQDFREQLNQLEGAEENLKEFYTWLLNFDSDTIYNDDSSYWKDLVIHDEGLESVDYNDELWLKMNLPELWEKEDRIGYFDGIVWFRKTISVPFEMVGKNLTLSLSAIDDMDFVYVNGQYIGGIQKPGFWQTIREYKVPKGIIHEGENTVAVKVIDPQGGGGFSNRPDKFKLSSNDQSVSLVGEWKYLPLAQVYNGKVYKFSYENTDTLNLKKPSIYINQNTPTVLYNAMINPLINYRIKGAVWYQGEANVGRAKQYAELLPTMIESWRAAWKNPDMPFYYVQIAPWNYGDPTAPSSAELREAQRVTQKVLNTGMAVTLDIGDLVTIHPGNKQDVGKRLALLSLANTYQKDVIALGPTYKSMKVKDNKAILDFNNIGEGLVLQESKVPVFEIAGEDMKFVKAKASINGNTVEVYSPSVKNPAAVRYGWANYTEATLFNSAGLPASSFSTVDIFSSK